MTRRRATPAASVLAIALLAAAASAQEVRPGDVRPELPAPGPTERPAPSLELPQVPAPSPAEGLASGVRLRVERFEITGSTVFGADELARAVAPFTGRELQTEGLLAARDAVTRLYVDAGYVTSGAVLPDQNPVGGVVRLGVVEGKLASVEVSGGSHFRQGFFASRLLRAGRAPLHMQELEQALRLLQRDTLIERVDAVLQPGKERGESRLVLNVHEGHRYHLGLEGSNERSPAIGSWGGSVDASFFNPIGWGEGVLAHGEFSEGLQDYEGRVEAPITPWDTRASLHYQWVKTKIVESPFDQLHIESREQTWGLELEQPVFRDDLDDLRIGLIGELRKLDTEVLGFGFCFEPEAGFSNPVSHCKGPRATVLRGQATWTRRTQVDALALRSLLSVGIDALGATTYGDSNLADGRFVSWLAQAQWAHLLPHALRDSQLVVRADLQLSNEPLLSFERFAIGGLTTVRGYRENQLVTDDGAIGSVEVRVPLWHDALGRHRIEIVPFMDVGYGWNDGAIPKGNLLWSFGIGLRVQPIDHASGEVWWGGRLKDVNDPKDHDLQDDGVVMRARVDVP